MKERETKRGQDAASFHDSGRDNKNILLRREILNFLPFAKTWLTTALLLSLLKPYFSLSSLLFFFLQGLKPCFPTLNI